MEADGKRFYNANGEETELMALMKQIGMNAIRLRVWVNPEKAYGPWCDKADVLAKARRAHEQGLALLIDFHYSDFFADPGRQDKPSAWATYSMDEVKKAVADHTRDVLQALKDEGIEPQWVQVGNETRSGMIWESGRIDWNKSGSARYTNYVALSNAGYEAVHAVLPEAKVIVHIDKGPDDNAWFYREFKAAGGKFDMIGLSHYPESNWQNENTKTANNVKSLGQTFGVPVMIVETGYSVSNETLAEQVMTDLFSKTQSLSQCAGIFYWEPELYGWWKPAYYTKLGWNAYGNRPGKEQHEQCCRQRSARTQHRKRQHQTKRNLYCWWAQGRKTISKPLHTHSVMHRAAASGRPPHPLPTRCRLVRTVVPGQRV